MMPGASRPSVLLVCFRATRVACHIVYGILLAALFPLLKRNMQQEIVKRWSRSLLDIMHVKLAAYGDEYMGGMPARVLVANHVSWLDVIAMNALASSCFVAKSEVGSWPVLGWLCKRVGTLFVRRDIRRDAVRTNREISALLEQGVHVSLFPEGTSSTGPLPGNFHGSLLQAAVDSGTQLGPVAIRYHDSQGRACDDAAFVGDMSFMQSMWNILSSPSLHVSLYYLPPFECVRKSRRALAKEARDAICTVLEDFPSVPSACGEDAEPPLSLDNPEPLLQA